jgi:type II secretory pathway component PulJ
MIHEKEGSCPVRNFIDSARRSEPAMHLRNARREILLAMKAVIDAGLRRLEAREEELKAENQGARKVEIQEG